MMAPNVGVHDVSLSQASGVHNTDHCVNRTSTVATRAVRFHSGTSRSSVYRPGLPSVVTGTNGIYTLSCGVGAAVCIVAGAD